MDRIFVAAALAYGLATMTALTASAMWLGDALAVKLMIVAWVAAYLTQVLQACAWMGKEAGSPFSWLSMVMWASTAVIAGAAIWSMVL